MYLGRLEHGHDHFMLENLVLAFPLPYRDSVRGEIQAVKLRMRFCCDTCLPHLSANPVVVDRVRGGMQTFAGVFVDGVELRTRGLTIPSCFFFPEFQDSQSSLPCMSYAASM